MCLSDRRRPPFQANTLYDKVMNDCRKDVPVNEGFPISGDSNGVYVLVLELDRPCRISPGKIPETEFPAGTYLYVGRAKKNLRARLLRHLRKEKTLFWHIDYLAKKAAVRKIWVKMDCFEECQVTADIHNFLGKNCLSIPGFGSSDCRCASHLLYFSGKKRVLRPLCQTIGFREVNINGNCF